MPSLDDASTNGRPSRFRRDSTRARGGTDDSRVVDERGDCDAPFHDVGRAPTRRARACAVARASATAAHLKNIIYNGKIALLTQKHQETPFPMEKRLDGSTRHSAANSRGGARERLRARRGNVKNMVAPSGGFGASSTAADIWDAVDDLRGDAHYRALDVETTATAAEIKRAFAKRARECHPDKGGDAETFAAVRKAFETLIDPKARATYDALMKEHQYRYIRGVTKRAVGGEDALLDDIERLGLENVCAATQLVTLCEVCGRPSTRVCYACTALFCDFCERKMHWKGSVGLHWPVQRVDGKMAKELGERQLEEKMKEDGERAMREDPNYRTDAELQTIRTFKETAAMVYHPDGRHKRKYDVGLAQHYMWAQSMRSVYIAINVPTGYADKELHFDFTGQTVLVQPEDSFPILDRVLANVVDTRYPAEIMQTEDRRFAMIEIRKRKIGEDWKKVFEGDSDYARCMKPLYTLTESNKEVVMEFELPFWKESDDVTVEITNEFIHVKVMGEFDMKREFWQKSQNEEKKDVEKWQPLDVDECTWSLDDGFERDSGDPCKTLMILLQKPDPTHEENEFQRGERSDNRNIYKHDERHGARFFRDDGDQYSLEILLQAALFVDTGSTWHQPTPAEAYKPPYMTGHYIKEFGKLPKQVQTIIGDLLEKRKEARVELEDDEFIDDELQYF